jgi:hypothetical protein
VLRDNDKTVKPSENKICMFCGSNENLTKEHMIPRWVFSRNTAAFFTVNLNGLDQSYNKATIPACAKCNAELLNDLEKTIQGLFENRDVVADPFEWTETQEIIRWLELIDYKFQIYNITRKFLVQKIGEKVDYLMNFPLYMLLQNKNYSPFQVLSAIRRSLKRLSVAKKYNHLNSLVAFKTGNKGFHFFHTIDEFIFLESPKHHIAIFYFLKQEFDTTSDAQDAAVKIIKKVY